MVYCLGLGWDNGFVGLDHPVPDWDIGS
jgi:hypothetical protein